MNQLEEELSAILAKADGLALEIATIDAQTHEWADSRALESIALELRLIRACLEGAEK